MAEETTKTPAKRKRRLSLPVLLLWGLVVVLAAALGYTIWLNRSLSTPDAQTKIAEQQSQAIIDAVSKLITVPSDKPTVATITDVAKLKQSNAAFYKDAVNGDVLLIYSTEAIVYRKSENKIIAVAPVVVNPTTEKSTKSTSSNSTNNTSNNATANNLDNSTNSTANTTSNTANNEANNTNL